MGFFDGLGKAFKAVGDSLGVAYDLATAPFSSDAESKQMMSIAASVNPFYRGYSETMPKIGTGLNALVDNPVVRPLAEGLNTAYTYGVSRPLSTSVMAGQEWDTFFDPTTWRVAWNASARVSPGQAVAAAGSLNIEDISKKRSVNDIASFVDAQNAKPEQDPWFKYTSGTLDFGANLADPLIVAGKAAKLARIKLVTKPLQTAGDAERYLDSARYAKFRTFAQAASSPAELRQVAFRNSAFGAQQAYVLYGVRNDDHAFRLAIRSMLDDEQAYTELAQINKDAAAQILTKKTEGDLSILTDREGLPDGHPEALTPDDVAKKDALSKVHVDAAQERVPLDAEMLSDLRGSLLGVGSPRVDRLMKTRATIHQKAVFDRPVILRPLYFMSNDNRHVPRINLNDLNSDRSLRMHMEKGGLDSETIDRYLTAYMGATTPERRFVIAGEAENEIVKKLAADHGIKQEDVDQILKAAANGRAKARSLGQKTNAYMTDEIVQKWQADGRMAEFDDNPEMALTWLDEEGAVNAAPVLETQTADFLPLVDPALLRQTFAKESARFQTAYAAGEKGLDMTQEALNSFHKMWKASALLRLGWPVRALSDEVARRTALWGAAPVMMSAVTGSLNTGRNAFARIRPGITTLSARNNSERIKMLEAMQQDAERAVRADSGELSGLPMQGMPEATPLAGKYQSVEEALADGRVAVKDHADSVRYLAEMGYAPETEAMLAGALKDGALTAAQFERKLLEHSLSKVGRDVYTRPSWQAEVMDAALDHHVELNPFSGETKGLARKGRVEVKSKMVSAGDDGHYSNDHLYDFVSENADTLLLPKHSVAIERADGGLKFSILREGDAATEAVPGVQITGHRIKDFQAAMKEFSKTSRSAVNEGVRVSDGQNTLDFGAPFRDGIMRHLVSAKGSFESMGIRETETNVDRLLSSKSFSAKIEPGDASYKSAWEQTVNKQVGQSAIAQKFLEGWDRDSVIAWLNDSAEGKQLIRRMPHVGKDTYGWAALVEHMVDTYVPDLTFTVKRDGQEFTESLRKKVLAGRATVDDLRAATNGQMPTVHGEEIQNALGKGELWKFVNKAVDQAYNILGTMPADKASRFPVFAQRYHAHLEILARGSRSMNGHSIATADYGRIERIAQRNALHDVKTWLYDTESTTEFARKMRYLMPFASAWQDSISHWTKIAAVENPASVGYLWNLWQAPEAAGLIVDQNGHELRTENGKSVWYSVDPESGNRTKVDPNAVKDLGKSRYVTFKLPSWASPDIFGKDVRVPIKINKDSFNTFLTASPGAGPVVQFPVNEIIRRHPTLEKSDNELYNWALKEILPFGVQGNSAMTLMPSAVRESVMQWRGEEDDIFNGRMMAIFQTEMTNYSLGKRSSKPSMDEAAKKASSMGVLRLMGALVLPVNPQYTSPYQPYVDAYRQLKAADPQNADAKFYDRYGEEYFWLTNRVTKAVTGIPPTQEGFKASQRYRDLIAEHPELAGLIVGAEGAGEFSKAVYEWQKGAPVAAGDERSQRERLSPRQQVDDIQQRLGWIKYGKLMDSIQADLSDRGLTNVTDQGAEDLLDMRKAWIEQQSNDMPAWHQQFNTVDRSKNDRQIAGMMKIASDPRLLQRDDIRGLADYLILREQVRKELEARAAGGMAKTLAAQENADLAQQWNDSVFSLVDSNLSFGSLYNRWLTNDDISGG